MNEYTVVTDGILPWVVDTKELKEAMEYLEWFFRGRLVDEPDPKNEDHIPYQELCDKTDPVYVGNDALELYPNASRLDFAPYHGLGTWTFE